MTTYVRLPKIDATEWVIKPKWIRTNSTLHAICWIEPKTDAEATERYFIRSAKSKLTVEPFPLTPSEDSNNRTVATCGREEVFGMLWDPLDPSVKLCMQCCRMIQSISRQTTTRLWSELLADTRVDMHANLFKKNGDSVAEWAMRQFPTYSPAQCCKMAKEIEGGSPNNGTTFINALMGEDLGVPQVELDDTMLDDGILGTVLDRINEAADRLNQTLIEAANLRARKTGEVVGTQAFTLDEATEKA